MVVQDVLHGIWNWAPLAYQESYDNATLIVGNPQQKVSNVLVSLDCTEEVVAEAVKRGCELVISHHPIVFKGLKSLTGKNYVERTVIKAIQHNIALCAVHTNLDNVHTGVNKKIGDILGLQNLSILTPKPDTLKKLFTFIPKDHLEAVRSAIFKAGAGTIGNYDSCSFSVLGEGTFRGGEETSPFVGKKGELHTEKEVKIEVVFPAPLQQRITDALQKAHPYEEVAYDVVALANPNPQVGAGMIGELPQPMQEKEFLSLVKKRFACGVIRHTALRQNPISKVAFCGGAGSFLLGAAKSSGADVYITGDFKYHEFFDAEGKIVVMDIGHFESEQFTIDLIADFLKQKFSTFAVHLSKVNTNPVHYF